MDSAKLVDTVKRAQAGEEAALNDLYLDAYKSVYYFALKVLRNPNDAEDVTQEVFITVQQRLADLNEPAAFYKWLNQITSRRCLNYVRDHKPLAGDEADEAAMLEKAEDDAFLLPDRAFDDAETRRIIMEVIDGLPVEQRFCIMAYYYEQLTIAQISESTGINENTIKSRLSLARKKIRAVLDAMEKKEGIKLYGIPMALTPILRQAMQEFRMPQGLEDSMWQNIMEATGIAFAGGGGAAASSEAAKAGAKEAAKKGVKAKVIGGAAGAVAVIGIATALLWPKPEQPAPVTPPPSSTPAVSQPATSMPEQPVSDVIVWREPNIEQAITMALMERGSEIPADGITPSTLNGIVQVTLTALPTGGYSIDFGATPFEVADATTLLYLDDLVNFRNLDTIIIDGDVPIAEVNFLGQLERTQNVIIQDCPNVSELPDMMGDSTFNLTLKNLSITALPDLGRVQYLVLNNCRISDISPLAELSDLMVLELIDLPVTDISALSSTTGLTRLSITRLPVSDMSMLSTLSNLLSLSLIETEITDISAITGMTSLDAISFHNNATIDPAPLTQVPTLTKLGLYNTAVTDQSVLDSLTGVEIKTE